MKQSNRAIRRKNKKVNNTLSSLTQITTVLNLSKEDLEKALISQNIRISGVLYDTPILQIKRYIEENKYYNQKFTFNKSVSQIQKDDNF